MWGGVSDRTNARWNPRRKAASSQSRVATKRRAILDGISAPGSERRYERSSAITVGGAAEPRKSGHNPISYLGLMSDETWV